MRVGQPEAGDRLAAAGLADEVLVVLALAGAFELVEPAALHAGHGLERGAAAELAQDRKSVVSGKSVSVRVDLGGRRIIKKKKEVQYHTISCTTYQQNTN